MERVSSFPWPGAGLLAILAATVFVPVALTAEEPADPVTGTYRLDAGDRIEVRVFGHPEFTVRLRVPPRGRVSFPAIPPIALRGRAIAEVEREITSQLKGKGLLKEPLVTVLVVDFEPRSVYVLGSVNRAGEYPLPVGRDLLLSHAISLAGGFAEFADSAHVRVLRTGEGLNESFEIDFREVENSKDFSRNLKMRNGDQIFVSELKSVYVMGEVRQPGRIRLPADTKLTVSRIIAAAGGFTERTADLSEVRVLRKTTTGSKTIEVDVLSYLDGDKKEPEPTVEPEDLIFVPRRGVF